MRDPEVLGNIDSARRAAGVDQIGNQLDIVFCRLRSAGRAGLAETFCRHTWRDRRRDGISLHEWRSPSARDAVDYVRRLI